MSDTCICGHADQYHKVIWASAENGHWDLGECKYEACKCDKLYRRSWSPSAKWINADQLSEISDASLLRGIHVHHEMVDILLDNYDSNEICRLSVFEFIEKFREDLKQEYDSYLKDKMIKKIRGE